jgi:hypothetical protein
MRFSLNVTKPVLGLAAAAVSTAAAVTFGVLLRELGASAAPFVVLQSVAALVFLGGSLSAPLAMRVTERALVIEHFGRDTVIALDDVVAIEPGPVITAGARTPAGRLLFDPRDRTPAPHLIPIEGGSATLLASEAWGPTVLVRRRQAQALLLRAEPFGEFVVALHAAFSRRRLEA